MLQTANQQHNGLQVLIGVFLQSCNAPQAVVDFLSAIGLSIASSSINSAIHSLSKQVKSSIHRAGHALLSIYAFDNLDLDLKHSTLTLEQSADTLIHLTTGL